METGVAEQPCNAIACLGRGARAPQDRRALADASHVARADRERRLRRRTDHQRDRAAQARFDRLFVAQAVLQGDDRGRRAEFGGERAQRAQRVGRADEHEEHLHAEQLARLARRVRRPRLTVDAQAASRDGVDDLAAVLEQHDLVRRRQALTEERAERAGADDPDPHRRRYRYARLGTGRILNNPIINTPVQKPPM